jgi:trans-aconitate 2-methyltransferase
MVGANSTREWNSSEYHRLSQPQLGWGKKVLARLRLRGDERLLDAGCGTGRLTALLLEIVPRGLVVALDLSRNMLNTAREHLTPRFHERVHFVAADLQDLPFEHAFNCIVSTAAFHWVLDHDRLFRSLQRALRPNGWLQAQCGGGPNLARLRKRMRALARSPRYARFLADFPEPWLYQNASRAADLLRRTGFVDVETNLEAAPTQLQNREQYSEFVKTIVLRAHLERLPDEKLRAHYVSDLTEQAAHDDPPFLLDYWRLNLSGRAPSSDY